MATAGLFGVEPFDLVSDAVDAYVAERDAYEALSDHEADAGARWAAAQTRLLYALLWDQLDQGEPLARLRGEIEALLQVLDGTGRVPADWAGLRVNHGWTPSPQSSGARSTEG